MFADDLRRDFYLRIKGQKVLVIVNYDVDAICACKILQSLFNTDYILYTLIPVDLSKDLKAAYDENHLDEKFIILINCGGTLDIIEELEPSEDVTFFILDNHRPLDVCNVYNTGQVILLSHHKQSEAIPDFHDIFRDDSDEEEPENVSGDEDDNGDDEEHENRYAKKQRLQEEAMAKRRDKRQWEEKRDKLMFDYTQYGYYGRSSALTIYELAWKLSKDSFDLLWYGILGLSEEMLMSKLDEETYLLECDHVQSHIARLTHRSSLLLDEGKNTAVKIEFEKEIPLTQCNQKFAAMDLVYRREFQDSLVKESEKYNLDGIDYVSFLMQHGFSSKYSAADFVYGLLTLLQSTNKDKSKADCFLDCLEALSRSKKEKIDHAIEKAKKLLVSVFKQVQSSLEMKQIQSAGAYLYLIIQEGCADSTICNHPYGLYLLAEFALKAYCADTKHKRYENLPLVVCTPYDLIPDAGSEDEQQKEVEALCHVIAIAPLAENSNKSFFGKAFEKAALDSQTKVIKSYFDSSVILINVKERSNFLKALTNLLS